MNERPLGRCCDCINLGITAFGPLCEASLPDWVTPYLREAESMLGEPATLTGLDVLKVRRCDCFVRRPADD